MSRALRNATTAALVATLLSLSSANEEPMAGWPDKVVTIEELRPLTEFRMQFPGAVAKGGVRNPSNLQVHINTSGAVVKAILLDSCGNADLDEAAIHAMRAMRFSPYTFGGIPQEVTLAIRIHVPKNLGRSR